MLERFFKPKSTSETKKAELVEIKFPVISKDKANYSHEDIINAILQKNIDGFKVFPQHRGTGTGTYKNTLIPQDLLIPGDYGDQYIYIKNLQMKIGEETQKVVIKFGAFTSMSGATVEILKIDDPIFQDCLQEHQQNS